jgi:hypothetical protein
MYCHANPLNNIDPTGMQSCSEITTVAAITFIIGSAVLAGIVKGYEKAIVTGSAIAAISAGLIAFGTTLLLGIAIYTLAIPFLIGVAAFLGISPIYVMALLMIVSMIFTYQYIWDAPMSTRAKVICTVLATVGFAVTIGASVASRNEWASNTIKQYGSLRTENHHGGVQQFRQWFVERGINIDKGQFLFKVPKTFHNRILHGGPRFEQFNAQWELFIQNNPDAGISKTLWHLGKLIMKYDLWLWGPPEGD